MIDITQTSDFVDLQDLLRRHVGQDNAVTIAAIGRALGHTNRRTTENLIEVSIPKLGYPVCSGHTGYFVPATADEINHYLASLSSRALCILTRRRNVMRAARSAGWSYDPATRRFERLSTQPDWIAENLGFFNTDPTT